MATKTKNEGKKTSFRDGLKKEWKRITWLSKEALIRRTSVVVAFSVLFGAIIAVTDFGAQRLLSLILH